LNETRNDPQLSLEMTFFQTKEPRCTLFLLLKNIRRFSELMNKLIMKETVLEDSNKEIKRKEGIKYFFKDFTSVTTSVKWLNNRILYTFSVLR